MNLSFMTYTATADAIKTTGLCQVLFRLFMVMLCVVLCILFEEFIQYDRLHLFIWPSGDWEWRGTSIFGVEVMLFSIINVFDSVPGSMKNRSLLPQLYLLLSTLSFLLCPFFSKNSLHFTSLLYYLCVHMMACCDTISVAAYFSHVS